MIPLWSPAAPCEVPASVAGGFPLCFAHRKPAAMMHEHPHPDPADSTGNVPSLADSNAPDLAPEAAAPTPEKESQKDPEDESTPGEDMPAPGNSTAGFDTLLGKIVVESGLVTADELEQCSEEAKSIDNPEDPRTLSDFLLGHDYVTRHQLDRLQKEFDAKKSSQRIPGYRILKKLGSGAMATVFLAKQVSLDRLVAIKVLPKKFSSDANFINRFYKEGRSAAQLNHANIVQAYDVGHAGDHHYFVMEYVEGETVYDRTKAEKRLQEPDAIDILIQASKALQHAHERGLIHRDIKPKNIMITGRNVVKLADLGLARAVDDVAAAKAEAGRAYGTPYYISPEQIRGEMDIGPGADIYGLGATCYHMVTGKVPFSGKNPSQVMHKHLKSELTPPDHLNPSLSAGFSQIIEMMMAKNREDRYQSATDLLEDLELSRKGEPPHFARAKVDLSQLAVKLGNPQNSPAVTPRPHTDGTGGAPLTTISLTINVVLVIALLVLIVILMT